MTSKQEKQKYILENLCNYVVDKAGNFVNVADFNIYGTDYFCIGKEAVEDHEEILFEISELIIKNRESWKLTYFDSDTPSPESFVNKKTGMIIPIGRLRWVDEKFLVGEFDYRGWYHGKKNDVGVLVWGDYDKKRVSIVADREVIKNKGKFQNQPNPNSLQSQQSEQAEELKKQLEEQRKKAEEEQKQPNQTPPPPSENNLPQVPSPKKPANNPDKLDQNNPSPKQEESNKSTNILFPSSADIQNNYNSDKDKSTINNNPNLTNQEQKNQANELLKVIITAELLIKETKFNQEILTKLLEIKKQDNSLYQILNKEHRIDKVISQLESIQKSNKNNNLGDNSKNHNKKQPISLGAKIFLGIGFSSLLVMIIIYLGVIKRNKKRRSNL